MEPRRKQQRTAQGETGSVVFNVGGRHFEVLRQTIELRPDTLLASLSEDIGTERGQPIFVDANPDRFGHILDWYRFGEMHLPRDCPVGGVLRDARFFLLPDFVRINGSSHQVCPEPANDACDAGVARVVDHWPGFEELVSGIIAELRRDFDAVGKEMTRLKDDVWCCRSAADVKHRLLPKRGIVLTKWCQNAMGHVWVDPSNVCNQGRLAVLLSELAKRGLHCDITAASGGCSRCGMHGSVHTNCLCGFLTAPCTQLELIVGHQIWGNAWSL